MASITHSPSVLTKNDIKRILRCAPAQKYYLAMALAYGAGLRISEIQNLRAGDIDLEKLTLYIKGNSKKEGRYVPFPKKLKKDFQELLAEKKENDFIFTSRQGGPLSIRSFQLAFKKALKSSGIAQKATFYSLRHSFAAHLLENGISVACIQKLLNHANIKTTRVYTKITKQEIKKIKSPLDS